MKDMETHPAPKGVGGGGRPGGFTIKENIVNEEAARGEEDSLRGERERVRVRGGW